ncbi:MAG: DUF1559 domain-containing protein [Planctomycetota bacterium]
MIRTRNVAIPFSRRGLTLIEVLVAILIICLLACWIAPAFQSARVNNRRIQCLHNIRNVGLAMQNYAAINSGRLPDLVSTKVITNGQGQQGKMSVPWTVQLLPVLDNATLLKSIRAHAVVNQGVASVNLGEGFENVAIDSFVCPDSSAYRKPGQLSYVVNAGHMPHNVWGTSTNNSPALVDWMTPPNPGDANDIAAGQAMGVIWPEGFVSSLEYIATGDGISTTILLTENLQAGNWYDTQTSALGFGIQLPVSLTTAYPNAGTASDPLLIKQAPHPDNWFINRNWSAARSKSPRPSSNHQGGVNVVMADGSLKFLSENMDKTVFMKLMTPNGIAYGEQDLGPASY